MDNQPTCVPDKGAIYVARNSATHRIQVSTATGSTVSFVNKGGGLVTTAPTAEFHRHFVLATEPPKLATAFFGGDWTSVLIPGYTYEGDRWNGWAKPFFVKEAADLVCNQISGLCYDAAADSCDITMDGELEQFAGRELDVPGIGSIKVYAIGAGSWCWDVWENGQDTRPFRVAVLKNPPTP